MITSSPAPAELRFRTGFENVSKRNSHTLDLEIEHWFEFAATHNADGGVGNGEGGAEMWIDTGISHSGYRSLGMSLFDISKSRRSEFVVFPRSIGLEEQFYVSVWLYLPHDWSLGVPGTNWNWYELASPFNTAGAPYSAIWIGQANPVRAEFSLTVGGRNANGQSYELNKFASFDLPRGRWFHLAYFVKRHLTKGRLIAWIDGETIVDARNIATKSSTTNEYATSVAKIYYERTDPLTHELYVDDLEIHDDIPQSAAPMIFEDDLESGSFLAWSRQVD